MATTETKERKTEGKETVTQVFYVIKGSENRQIGQGKNLSQGQGGTMPPRASRVGQKRWP